MLLLLSLSAVGRARISQDLNFRPLAYHPMLLLPWAQRILLPRAAATDLRFAMWIVPIRPDADFVRSRRCSPP